MLAQDVLRGNDITHLLADRNINAEHVLAGLINDGIQSYSCLTCLTVTYDELSLSSSYRSQGIDRGKLRR